MTTNIRINSKQYHTDTTTLTGQQLKALAANDGVAPDFELFLVHEPGSGKPALPQVWQIAKGLDAKMVC